MTVCRSSLLHGCVHPLQVCVHLSFSWKLTGHTPLGEKEGVRIILLVVHVCMSVPSPNSWK